ncbi:serine/threonine protein kinase [Chondromyces crocatus]|uniref:Protein kinase domain-containing protein n=1 Tax=Chondromyces crocatus TaxID=52 RepID=A0A0K1EIM3_CHOCO|nr:serine/threonine-protein kinase [Chondromyces crocatus]AKT40443.1 uncharacterized protein CMC5_045960 [Chondromyces crocatus]
MLFPSELKPGDTLGRYEILAPIAKGGMAAVWAARLVGTRGFQKIVAIKTMLPDLSDNADFEAMFLDEARLASRIRHPHVVEIVDLGDEEGLLYLVMEWVDGETIFTLNKSAKANGGIPLRILLKIVSDACAGLHAAHELRDDKGQLLNLVHRDISPQNIMVSFDGIVKIVDFGVAKAAGRLHETQVGSVMKGKVPYLSPEQLMSGKVDRRADIFALGILIYASLTGKHPFRGENDARTIENIARRAHVPLRDFALDVPPELEDAVDRALSKNPADRWPDCAALQRALQEMASTVGPPVTDGDVARYVRSTLGDVVEERRKRLAVAIQLADARVGTDRSRSSGVRPATRGGAPLPATYSGIIPVQLDERAEEQDAAPESVPLAPDARAVAPGAILATTRPRRSALPYALVAVLVLLVGAALALRAGLLPVPDAVRPHLPRLIAPPQSGGPPAPADPAPLQP